MIFTPPPAWSPPPPCGLKLPLIPPGPLPVCTLKRCFVTTASIRAPNGRRVTQPAECPGRLIHHLVVLVFESTAQHGDCLQAAMVLGRVDAPLADLQVGIFHDAFEQGGDSRRAG